MTGARREIPAEVPTLVSALSRGGSPNSEIAYVLHRLDYSDAVVARAMGVTPSTVAAGRSRFGRKLKTDAPARARVTHLLGADCAVSA